METLHIFALGEDFDVDAFLPTTTLAIARVWRRGELRGHPDFIQDAYPNSGVAIALSPTQEALSLWEQDNLATEYLEHHAEQLKQLGTYPGVTAFTLALQENIVLERGLQGFAESFSLRLMWFALKIGIKPQVYVNLDWSQVDDEL